jgi:hypothetical protein
MRPGASKRRGKLPQYSLIAVIIELIVSERPNPTSYNRLSRSSMPINGSIRTSVDRQVTPYHTTLRHKSSYCLRAQYIGSEPFLLEELEGTQRWAWISVLALSASVLQDRPRFGSDSIIVESKACIESTYVRNLTYSGFEKYCRYAR